MNPHSETARWENVGEEQRFAGPGPYAVSVAGIELVLARGRHGLRAFEGLCPHQGALLGEGEIDGDYLVCRNHRWRFDLESGRRNGGPGCLRSVPVREDGHAVWVDLSGLSNESARTGRDLLRPRDLRGPRGLPLFGNAHQFSIPEFHLAIESWAREYGTPFRFRIGSRTIVVLGEAEPAALALRARPGSFRRLGSVEPVLREMGLHGVFSAEGEEWPPLRRLTMEALSPHVLRAFYPTLRGMALRFRDRLARMEGTDLGIREEMARFTVDVTTSLVFGYDVRALENDDDSIQREIAAVFRKIADRVFAVIPYWRWLKLPSDRDLDVALGKLHAWMRERIAECRRALAAEPARAHAPANLLEAMISARDAHGRPYSDELIIGNAMTLLLAGEDTTSNTLAWALHELCEHPQAAVRLREEADGMLKDEPVPSDADLAGRLPYATAIAFETMRLRPAAPLILLECVQESEVGNLLLEKGDGVVILTRTIAGHEDRFADSARFLPDRWVRSSSDGSAHDVSAYLPFGSGPRVCPGRSLALLEMRVTLAMISRNFDIERVGSRGEVRERFAFTMGPENLRMRLRVRRSTSRP